MIEALSPRQQDLLKALLAHRDGLTVDELTQELGITRTAVNQHLDALGSVQYIEPGERVSSGGRPRQTYRLTKKGYEVFPKQYSWFSEVLIEAIRKEKGPEGLARFLGELGALTASGLEKRLVGMSRFQQIREIARILNELAYQAEATSPDEIRATNCVYHKLATSHPEVCQFDLALLEKLSGRTVVHQECIVRGGHACRFRLR